jgi:hypothetical protein
VLAAPKPEQTPAPVPPTKSPETPKAGAPEKYALKAVANFDTEVMTAYEGVARELDLSQKDAQMLIDRVAPVVDARLTAKIEAVHNEWQQATRTDKEFGGDKLPENLAVARKFLDRFAPPALRELLDQPGIGDHPDFIRMIVRAGKVLMSDKFVAGSGGVGPSNSEEAILAKLYPTHVK